MNLTPTIKLNTNTEIPILGFGTYGLDKGKEQSSIEYALEVGYRHIDTADIYGTHPFIANAISNSNIPRREVFITTKLWKTDLNANAARVALQRFLDELETNYIDLLLIHRPNPEVPIKETLSVMNEFKEDEEVKSIGVSNFEIDQLQDALDTGIEFNMNQIEIHPSASREELRKFCSDNDIPITAYSPLGRGSELTRESIIQLADKYKRDPAQVIINWELQHGMVSIPRSSEKDHILSNYKSLEWSLSDEDIALVDTFDTNTRIEE